MNRILLIEDEPGVCMTVGDRLEAEDYEVAVKGDGISGQREAERGGYDCILLDIMLPERDGFTVCLNLRKKGIETPILMLTARNTDIDTVVGLRQGADDYLGKPFDMNVLLARIEALLRRTKQSKAKPQRDTSRQTNTPRRAGICEGGDNRHDMDSPDRINYSSIISYSSCGAYNSAGAGIRFGAFLLDTERGELSRDTRPVELNVQEYKLLEFLAKRPGYILSRDKILDEVWGYENETTTRTVDVHIAKLRYKLGESDMPRHIITIRGRGYKFVIS